MRLVVATKIAFVTAGRIAGTAGSPNPVGGLSDFNQCTSISGGACVMRTGGYLSKFACIARPRSKVISQDITLLSASITDPCTWFSALLGLMMCRPMSAATQTLFTFTLLLASTVRSTTSAK